MKLYIIIFHQLQKKSSKPTRGGSFFQHHRRQSRCQAPVKVDLSASSQIEGTANDILKNEFFGGVMES